MNHTTIVKHLASGSTRHLARAISLVENEVPGYQELLMQLRPVANTSIVGITGPPGAGKSTVTDALMEEWVNGGKRVAVLCVDPSSPFHHGALLGDRIRMSKWYNHPNVFIRSLATRGNLGGLHPKIIEITDVVLAAGFDYLVIETVGVGQNEVEIAGLADTTVLVLVPEAGDEIQNMKAGVMEIADVFVVNKADRPGSDLFIKNLRSIVHNPNLPVLRTVATHQEGIAALATCLLAQQQQTSMDKKGNLMAEKAYLVIQKERMKGIDKEELAAEIKDRLNTPGFNLYQFARSKTFVAVPAKTGL